jgi:hypothetical protein
MSETNVFDLLHEYTRILKRPNKFEVGQKEAILKMLDFVQKPQKHNGGLVMIEPGGGKTLPLITTALIFASQGKKVLIVSPSGPAFVNIQHHFAGEKQEFMADKLSLDFDSYKDFCSRETHHLKTKSSISDIRSFPILFTHIDFLFRMIKENDKTTSSLYMDSLKKYVDVVLIDEWHTLSFFSDSPPSFKQKSVLSSVCETIPFIGFTGNKVKDSRLATIYKGVGRPTRRIVAHLIEFYEDDKLVTTKTSHQKMLNGAAPELLAASCFTTLIDLCDYMRRHYFNCGKMLIFKNGVDTHAKFIDQLNEIARSEQLFHPFTGKPLRIYQMTPELRKNPSSFDVLVSDQAGRESLDIPEVVFVVDLAKGTEKGRIVQTARRAARMCTNTAYGDFSKMDQIGHFYAPLCYKATLEETNIEICGTSSIDFYENHHKSGMCGYLFALNSTRRRIQERLAFIARERDCF